MVEQGRKSNALFILLNGRARVLTSDCRGREVILAVLESGDYVGEMSLIDNEPHSATVRAEIQTDMLVLARADFARCLPETARLAYGIMRGLVRRLRNADRQIESLALLDVYGRVARTLLDMAEEVDGMQDHPSQGQPPGHGQGGGCLARDGEPGDEGPGGARRHRDAGQRLRRHQGTPAERLHPRVGGGPGSATMPAMSFPLGSLQGDGSSRRDRDDGWRRRALAAATGAALPVPFAWVLFVLAMIDARRARHRFHDLRHR